MRTRPIGDLLFWQSNFRVDNTQADILRRLRNRRSATEAEVDALWSGWFALQESAKHCVACALSAGQILTMFDAA